MAKKQKTYVPRSQRNQDSQFFGLPTWLAALIGVAILAIVGRILAGEESLGKRERVKRAPILTGQIIHNSYGVAIMFRSALV